MRSFWSTSARLHGTLPSLIRQPSGQYPLMENTWGSSCSKEIKIVQSSSLTRLLPIPPKVSPASLVIEPSRF